MFYPDLRCSLFIHVHINIHIWHKLSTALDSTTRTLLKKEKQQQRSDQSKCAEPTKFWTCMNTVIFAACDQWASATASLLQAVWRLNLLLFSDALMWSCTGRSAAPCLAVSATVSCGVWAEADEPEVQEAPVPRCSPASSPALMTRSRVCFREPLWNFISHIFKQFGELNDLVGQKLLKSKGLPSSSLSMKSILWETSSWTASMWSSRLIRHCWCCLLLSEASPESLTPSSLFSVCDHEPPNEAWTFLREKNGRIYLQSTWELYKDLFVNVFTLRKNKVYDGVILNYIINQKGPVQLRSNAHMRWVILRNAD